MSTSLPKKTAGRHPLSPDGLPRDQNLQVKLTVVELDAFDAECEETGKDRQVLSRKALRKVCPVIVGEK